MGVGGGRGACWDLQLITVCSENIISGANALAWVFVQHQPLFSVQCMGSVGTIVFSSLFSRSKSLS